MEYFILTGMITGKQIAVRSQGNENSQNSSYIVIPKSTRLPKLLWILACFVSKIIYIDVGYTHSHKKFQNYNTVFNSTNLKYTIQDYEISRKYLLLLRF